MKQIMKRSLALLLCAVMVLGFVPVGASAADTEITLWSYPVGNWGSEEATYSLLREFEEANPGITVKYERLDYADGDAKVNTAIEAGCAPDLILEGPERLVSMWGNRGVMVDMSGMLDSSDKSQINANVLDAGYGRDGGLYMYPLTGTAHTMAINKTVFKAAGAMTHINETTRTWKSTEDFFAAVEKVRAYTKKTVGVIYCRGQGGDQGTRALVTNLYDGRYTNADHTAYTWNTAAINNALADLRTLPGIDFREDLVGGDEIALLYNGVLNMAFCWNIAQQLNPNNKYTGAGKTANGDEIMFLAFPSTGTPRLQGGIWGFGIVDNGDSARIAAAKKFVKYMCDSAATVEAVRLSGYFPVRSTAGSTSMADVWSDDAVMKEYGKTMMPLMGDYYQTTPNWPEARTSWWNLLQLVGAGNNIEKLTREYTLILNAGIELPPLPLKIKVQPQDVTVAAGEKAVVSFTASGDGLTYTWYYKNPGATKFSKTTAFTTNTYSVSMDEARDGRQVYCVVTDANGDTVRTNTVTLSMAKSAVKIVTQPKSVWVAEGKTARVTVQAEGDGLTYKWYYKNPGAAKYTYTDSFKGSSYSVTMNEARSGRYVFCRVYDKYGNMVQTKTVSLNMQTPLEILTQPASVRVASGKTAKVTVKAQGDGLTYEWYYKNPGAAKYTKTDAFTGNSYSVTMNASRDGRYVFCRVYDKYGSMVQTKTVSLRMK